MFCHDQNTTAEKNGGKSERSCLKKTQKVLRSSEWKEKIYILHMALWL